MRTSYNFAVPQNASYKSENRIAREVAPIFTCPVMIGESAGMTKLRARIERFAKSDAPILILGESGSGKELCARAVHQSSKVADGPFIAVNCAAISRDLIESELFGTRQGAFTGACNRDGFLARAAGGTLFLDEIGDLPLNVQAVLLRVLETREFYPVGSTTPVAFTARVVSATHQPLQRRVAQKTFRTDLYHRLAGITLDVPPLRERLDDLELLAQSFVGNEIRRFTPSAWKRLQNYRWPGNIRELKNILQRAVLESDGAPITSAFIALQEEPEEAPSSASSLPLDIQIAQIVQKAVLQQHGNIRATARVLVTSPTTIYRYLAIAEELPAAIA